MRSLLRVTGRAPLLRGRAQPGLDRGMVTAEIAVALPVLVFVTAVALWGVVAVSTQLACADAVRSGARAAARGEPLPAVRAAVTQAVPPGATVLVARDGELASVEVSVPVRAPALSGLPPVVLRARALAPTEPGTPPP